MVFVLGHLNLIRQNLLDIGSAETRGKRAGSPSFTIRNSTCGKVMFSQACVIPSVHGGGYIPACN